jgi:hypothetical protein
VSTKTFVVTPDPARGTTRLPAVTQCLVAIEGVIKNQEQPMKIKALLCVAGIVAAGTAFAGGNHSGNPNILFVFDGSIGVQPFRTTAGAPANNVVAGVNAAGVPWGMTSFQAIIRNTGDIRARGNGVLLLGTDNIGTRGGPRQVVLSLFCRNAPVAPATVGSVNTANPFNSAPVDLDEDGDFSLRGKLTDAMGATPPLDCGDTIDNRPVLLVRSVSAATPAVPGAWFAAGVLASKWNKGRWKYWD